MPASAIERLLLSRGEDLSWVDDVSEFKCSGCGQILVHYFTAECGHKFCPDCVETHESKNEDLLCPLAACLKHSEFFHSTEDAEFVDRLLNLRTHCPNRMYGCTIVLQLKDLKHLNSCKNPKDKGIYGMLLKLCAEMGDVKNSVSEVKNSINEVKGSISDMKTDMKNLRKVRVKGQEKRKMPCDDVEDEGSEDKRQKTIESEADQVPDPNPSEAMAPPPVLKEQTEPEAPEPIQMSSFNLVERHGEFTPCLKWKISGIGEKMKQRMMEVQSEEFVWPEYLHLAGAKLTLKKDGCVYMSLWLAYINRLTDLKLIPRVYYLLKDQLGNSDFRHRCRSTYCLFDNKFSYSTSFETNVSHKSWFTDPLHNIDDSVLVEVYVEPMATMTQVHSYNGTLDYYVDNCQKKLGLVKDLCLWTDESPYFYTGPKGYRVQAAVWLNGLGFYKGRGLTVLISFLSGQFDEELPKSFAHRITVTLLNRKDPACNVTKIVDGNIKDKQTFSLDICEKKEVANLIEDDSLYYKVTVRQVIKVN